MIVNIHATAPLGNTSRSPRYRQVMTVSLLFGGYASMYFCREDVSVATPLLIEELTAHGMSHADAIVRIGTLTSFGVLAYALGKLFLGGLGDVWGRRVRLLGCGGGRRQRGASRGKIRLAGRVRVAMGSERRGRSWSHLFAVFDGARSRRREASVMSVIHEPRRLEATPELLTIEWQDGAGRTVFSSARHARHLRGGYLTRDSVYSQTAVLRRRTSGG